jgi:hypothetical protein
MHEDESKATATPAANEYVASTTNSNMENLDVTSSEVTRANFLDVTNATEYTLSSTSDFATSSAALQDSAPHSYLQENRQFQNVSPLSNFMVCTHVSLVLTCTDIAQLKKKETRCFYFFFLGELSIISLRRKKVPRCAQHTPPHTTHPHIRTQHTHP